jgi:leader peptidase (prepilin peptidase)/N-methyltransferase
MGFLIYIFVFVLGTVIGSFLNVVILRYNTGFSIINGKSKCLTCGKELEWYELIPIASFIIQKGKCNKCGSKISWQYPLVEITTGFLFLLIIKTITGYGILAIGYYFVVFSLLIIITVYDMRHQIIPNPFVYFFDVLAFLSLFQILGYGIDFSGFIAGLAFFAFFGSFWLFSKGKWMGLGDAKLALGIGWLLGLQKGILAMLFSFWIGTIVSIFLMFFYKNKINMKSKIAFGPFMALGILIAFLYGGDIIRDIPLSWIN